MKPRSVEWQTPLELFRILNMIFGPFELDAAASSSNTLCERFFSQEDDALRREWRATKVWLNPPYGRGLHVWVRKAVEAVKYLECDLVCCLLPAKPDAPFWRIVEEDASYVRFLRKRVHFVGGGRPRFGCAVVVFEALKIRGLL